MPHSQDLSHLIEIDVERVHFLVRFCKSFHEINLHLNLTQLLVKSFLLFKLLDLLDIDSDFLSELHNRLG